MENKIKGYRELNDKEIELINEVKSKGRALSDLIRKLGAEDADKRWLAIGKTDFQTGLMALVRSIAKPDFF